MAARRRVPRQGQGSQAAPQPGARPSPPSCHGACAPPRDASVLARARLGERSLLHDRRRALLAAWSSHHDSEDSLKRGGYHSRHLVHAAHQLRHVFPECDQLDAVLPLPTRECIDPPVGGMSSIRLLVSVEATVDQLHVRPSLHAQSNAYAYDREHQAGEFHIHPGNRSSGLGRTAVPGRDWDRKRKPVSNGFPARGCRSTLPECVIVTPD